MPSSRPAAGVQRAALIRAGVAEVVYGIDDPDARGGRARAQALRDAGITVRSGVMADACLALNPGYLTRQRLGRPRIVLKTAVTLEGAAATSAGESQWITGRRRAGWCTSCAVGWRRFSSAPKLRAEMRCG